MNTNISWRRVASDRTVYIKELHQHEIVQKTTNPPPVVTICVLFYRFLVDWASNNKNYIKIPRNNRKLISARCVVENGKCMHAKWNCINFNTSHCFFLHLYVPIFLALPRLFFLTTIIMLFYLRKDEWQVEKWTHCTLHGMRIFDTF